jgi:Xaa-Pro aminopeptidase
MFASATYQQRRCRLVGRIEGGLILLLGNVGSPINSVDNCYPFRQDSSFLYFCGLNWPGLALLLDIEEGTETLFGPEQTEQDIIWSGPQPSLSDMAALAGLAAAMPRDALQGVVRTALNKGRRVHFLPTCRTDSALHLALLLERPVSIAGELVSEPLIRAVVELRSVKDPEEVLELDAAADLGGQLHAVARQMARPGIHEWQIAGELQAVAAKARRQLSFTPIVTTRGEVLHNHDRSRQLAAGDLLLVDCGVESSLHYASDHTRTLPVGGSFSERQRDVYRAVIAGMERARQLIRPGVRFLDVHHAVCLTLAGALRDLGLMRGDSEEAVAAGAHALFMPHGLGHMLGLDVHDMEDLGEDYVGYDERTRRSDQFGTSALRLGRELRAGFALTVEPGLYFIPALIEKWQNCSRHDEFINYTELSGYLDFGGIRVEDDVLVTEEGNRLLGRPIPSAIDEIENCLEESPGP